MRLRIAIAVSLPALFTVACAPSPGSDDVAPASAAIRIHLSGSGVGSIHSSSPAFDCSAECTQKTQIGAALHLTATAAAGSQFMGWVAGCDGTAGCDLTIAGDTDVTAKFDSVPPPAPPPPPDCDGSLPGSLGASVSATVPGTANCENQTSDGAGNVAADATAHWYVFSAAGARLGDYVADGAIPQDTGFQGIETRGTVDPPKKVFAKRRPDGTVEKESDFSAGIESRAWRSLTGGAVVVTRTCGVHAGGIAIDRFDGAGSLLSRGGPATGGCTNGITAGVGDAKGSTFLIFSGARDVGFGTDIVGRWFDAAAHSQTDFFAVANGSPQQLAVRALVGVGVAVQIDGTWVATIASGAFRVSALPPWLSENANHDFTVVRSRRAYAVLPRGSGDPNAITMY